MPDKTDDVVALVYKRFRQAKDHTHRKQYEDDAKEAHRAFKGHPFSEADETKMNKDAIKQYLLTTLSRKYNMRKLSKVIDELENEFDIELRNFIQEV